MKFFPEKWPEPHEKVRHIPPALFLQKTLEFITPIRYNRIQYEYMYTKYCLTQGWDVTKMSNVTMMELSKELDEQFDRLLNECMVSGEIDQELYTEYDVKRGLHDANGKGVLTGLT